MRGMIVKRGNSYRIKVSLGKDAATGKYVSHYETVRGKKKDAERRLIELIYQQENGIFIKPSKLTVADYLKQWLNDYVYMNLSPSTAEGYESIIVKHLIPSLGNAPLTQLRPEMIQRYISDKLTSGRTHSEGGLNALTVRHHIVCLHTALQSAVKTGMLIRNIVDLVTMPRAERHEMQIMSESDIHVFLEMASPTPYYALFYAALFTGMRRSELLALRWQDIDFRSLQISVNRSLHKIRGGQIVVRQPKTQMSRRLVALTPSTASILREYHDAQNELRAHLGCSKLADTDLVFCHHDGRPFLPNTVTRNWIRLVRRSGLKDIRFHDARHTHASLMLKQGVHPKVVQERLGHSSIRVTLDNYSHLVPGLQQKAAEIFDSIVLAKQAAPALD